MFQFGAERLFGGRLLLTDEAGPGHLERTMLGSLMFPVDSICVQSLLDFCHHEPCKRVAGHAIIL